MACRCLFGLDRPGFIDDDGLHSSELVMESFIGQHQRKTLRRRDHRGRQLFELLGLEALFRIGGECFADSLKKSIDFGSGMNDLCQAVRIELWLERLWLERKCRVCAIAATQPT